MRAITNSFLQQHLTKGIQSILVSFYNFSTRMPMLMSALSGRQWIAEGLHFTCGGPRRPWFTFQSVGLMGHGWLRRFSPNESPIPSISRLTALNSISIAMLLVL